MSRQKSAKPKRRAQYEKRRLAESNLEAEKPSSPTESKTNHLGPVTTALIVLPFVALVTYFCWSVLRTDEETPLAETNPATTKKETPAVYPWMQFQSGQAWVSEEDRAKAWDQIDNPAADGWETEVLSNQVGEQLTKLKKLMTGEGEIDAKAIAKLAIADVRSQPLVPIDLDTTYQDHAFHVRRATFAKSPSTIPATEGTTGTDTLAESIRTMLQPYRDRQQLRVKLKVFRVNKIKDGFRTHQSLELFGETEKGLKEENAIWIAEWEKRGDVPILRDLRVSEYETVDRTGKSLFADCTEAALGQTDSFQQQLSVGYDQWLERSQFNRFMSLASMPGVAIGDVNGDGLDDVYACQEAGLPNLLYLQNNDGTVRDASRDSGVDWLQSSTAALIIDLDNDGHNDLAVGVTGGVVLAKGDGTGRFTKQITLDSSDHIVTLTAADYDRDGRLDLYAGSYFADGIDRENEDIVASNEFADTAYGDVNDIGATNNLFHNEWAGGRWAFRDVTDSVGMDKNNQRLTFAASWEDYDNDGDQDLYVANDYGLNYLYRNDTPPGGPGKFVDVANATNAEDTAFSMAVAWGDYDRDGWMDVYISNMFSYAGNRIAFQDQFHAEASEKVRTGYQRFARGNTLLRNLGKPDDDSTIKFQDESVDEHVNRARWAWGSRFVDLNNDGWDDLVVANGYITAGDNGDL